MRTACRTRGRTRAVLTGLALVALAACEPVAPVTAPAPPARPQVTAAPPEPSEDSERIRLRLALVQANLLDKGLLRTDGGGRDTPYNARQLADNFIRIALYDEYAPGSSGLVARQTASRLRRWEQPVRMALEFGPSVSEAQQAKDRADVTAYAARLSRITGLPIRMVGPEAANFTVLVLNEDERRAAGPRLRQLLPGIDGGSSAMITGLPEPIFCAVFAFSPGAGGSYTRAIAIVRAEHPTRMRLSCFHEEIAQGLGLANDSPSARPSIFNDDDEFALLTGMDELMLKMLYDPRLRPGMTPDEARPIVETMARELLGGDS
ncbi:DUF2927 domain-containing protein [Frigidibacter oleivorans]|uniref:DUF2927 domain-containing protein n=1 Tax=Frigidibacter oleivorans TaxID=2487129 RepID=UPI000F8C885A|nr:DUF2927 domain-containing protein [Frigidibacter oleivorans]